MYVSLFTFLTMPLPIPLIKISKYHSHKNAWKSVKAHIIANTCVHCISKHFKDCFWFWVPTVFLQQTQPMFPLSTLQG